MYTKEIIKEQLDQKWPKDEFSVIEVNPETGAFTSICNTCGKKSHYEKVDGLRRRREYCQRCHPHNSSISKKEFQKRIDDHFVGQSYTVLEFLSICAGAKIRCNKCGREFFHKDCGHIKRQKTLCKHCYATIAFGQHTTETIQKQVDDLFGKGNFEILEYDAVTKKIKIRHLCGFIYTRDLSRFKDRGRCPQCDKANSKGEIEIAKILQKYHIPYESEKTFPDLMGENKPLRYDFYVDGKFLIEFHGQQHYEANDFFGGEEAFTKRLYYDDIKEHYAHGEGIPLLIIPYYERKNLESIILEFLKSNDYPLEGVESSDSK